jgi:hypothetical protein
MDHNADFWFIGDLTGLRLSYYRLELLANVFSIEVTRSNCSKNLD